MTSPPGSPGAPGGDRPAGPIRAISPGPHHPQARPTGGARPSPAAHPTLSTRVPGRSASRSGGAAPPAPGPLPPGSGRAQLLAEVVRALAPLPMGASALVAVSGGPDSTALAYLAAEAREDLTLTLGHVSHGLGDDALYLRTVRSHAAALGLPLQAAEVSVQAAGEGLEAAARAARYAALRRLSREVGAGWLLVGHTAEDQAETVLLRIARGTGIGGLGGMAPVRGDVVRPLLRLRRADVRRFVEMEGLDAVEDPMNRDDAFRRVRARDEVLPMLERLAPDPVGALSRLADLARADARLLEAEAERAAMRVVRTYGPGRAVPVEPLASLDPALARRVVRHLLAEVRGSSMALSSGHVSAVLGLHPGEALDVPGATVTCGGGWLAAVPPELPAAEPLPLNVPGTTSWGPAGVVVHAAVAGFDADGQLLLPLSLRWQPPRVEIPADALPPGGDAQLGEAILGRPDAGDDDPTAPPRLTVRSRRAGDRVQTRGGNRKLQDLFVDAGVPRALRDLVPVVAWGRRVVWVPGVAVDAAALLAGRQRPRLHLAVGR